MGEPAFACFYFLFAIMFATVNVIVQDVKVRSQMYEAVVTRYIGMPYKYKPEKYFDHISVPSELYQYLMQAFIPVTYNERPVNGDPQGFCTAGHPCYINQGDCDLDSQCQPGLVCGDKSILSSGMMVNGNYWDTQELVDFCKYQGTPVNLYRDGAMSPPELQNCTSSPTVLGSLPPCCWDDRANDWITLITNASDPSLSSTTTNLVGRGNCPTSTGIDGDCCAKLSNEPLNINETDAIAAAAVDNLPVTVADFNRVLMIRFTTKRYRQVPAQGGSPAFANLMPTVLSNNGQSLEAAADNGNMENKTTFTGVEMPTPTTYTWQTDGSWHDAGGYVEWVNPVDGESAMGMTLERMFLDGIFDNTLGVFTLDMMLYNGNADTFMHVSVQFIFDPSGACTKRYDVMFSNLKGMKGNRAIAKYIEYFFLIPVVAFFVFWEVKKLAEVSFAQHFGRANAWIDMLSLLLCATVLGMNFLIQFNATYLDFKFDEDNPLGFTDKQAYLDMVYLQRLISLQVYFVAINLLMIFFRSVVLVTSLEANLGLIIATLGQAMVNIMYFFMTFMFLLIGFVAFAFFTFGSQPRDSGMTSPAITFFQTFSMLLGQQNFEGLKKADPMMAVFFYFSFYIMVSFVMLNMFVSILLSGYDVCDFELKKKAEKRKKDKEEEKSLFRKVVDDFKNDIFGKCSAKIRDCAVATWHSCIKPFFVGITSCFKDCLSACDCGLQFPPVKKLCGVLFFCFKPAGEVRWDDVMATELKRSSKLMKGCEKANAKLVKKNAPPQKAEHLNDEKNKVVEKVKEYDKRKITADKERTNLFTEAEVDEFRVLNNALEEEVEEVTEVVTVQEQVCMLSFMVVFVTMLILMTRGEDSFWVTKATRDPVIDQTWLMPKPLRRSDFSHIDSMEEAGQWASSVLVNEMYKNLACRVRPGTQMPSDVADCDNSDDNMQLVQKLNNWNIGFLNTTFVRATIQPACFVLNDEKRFRGGAEYLRSVTMNGACADRACFAESLDAEGTCRNSGGDAIDKKAFPTSNLMDADQNAVLYNYSEPNIGLGPYGLSGGFVVSLGTTKEQAKTMVDTMIADMWFTKNSASIVFDWLTYNGNLDMFTYNVVAFSLLETGMLQTELISQKFPLNVEEGGGPFNDIRLLIMILFVAYTVMVVYFIGDQLMGLYVAHKRAKRSKQAPYYFLVAYYKNLWNRTDSLSLLITVISIAIYFQYLMGNAFRVQYKFAIGSADKYSIPPSAVKEFGMYPEIDPRRALEDDWYIFLQMGKIGSTYDLYLNLAAVNAFFIAVKVVKYSNALKPFQIYASTLAEGSERMLYFSFVILLLLVGWSLFFLVLFGVYDSSVSDPSSAVTTLFTWMLGDFQLERMLAAREIPAILFFVLFEVMMYFICINMFLATMLNTYSETIGGMEVAAEKQKMQDERENDLIEIEYVDKQELRGDITIKKDELGEVWVKEVKQSGKAAIANVSGGGPGVGNQVLKVGNDKQEWKDHSTEEEIIEDGIQPDPRDNQIRITFKAPHLKKQSWLEKTMSTLIGQAKSQGGSLSKPTVKTFWHKHGAVTFTYAEVMKHEKTMAEPIDEDGGEGESQDGANKEEAEKAKADLGGSEMKAVNARVKKKLDCLLFSRAARVTGADGVDPFDISHFDNKPADAAAAGEEAKVETDIDTDELRNMIELEPVFGNEVWLDCLMTQIEHEMEDESVVTEVLRTSDMQEAHRGQGPAKQDSLNNFYKSVIDILSILECKAKEKWYRCLKEESELRLTMFRKQNDILHDYACELEAFFADIMQKIHVFKAKKDMMITKLSGLLDKQSYKHLDNSGAPDDRSHLERLSIPWPDAMVHGGGGAGQLANMGNI